MKRKIKKVKVTPAMILQIKLAEKAMDARNINKGEKNKAIKTMTGIKSVDTIRLIRESGFDYDKYKASLPLRYPYSYSKNSTCNDVKEDHKSLPLDEATNCESQVYNYLGFCYGNKTLEKIQVLVNIITTLTEKEIYYGSQNQTNTEERSSKEQTTIKL